MVTRHIWRDLAFAVGGAAVLSTLLASSLAIRSAGAQDAPPQDAPLQDAPLQVMPPPALQQACAGDVLALCPGITPGGGRIKQCFIAKRGQLSFGCKRALLEARNTMSGK